jgi:hypothetical protein
VSRLRFVPGQHVVEITTRTQHGRLLLRPGPVFNEIVYGILGRAQRLYGMTIHYAAVLSNHYHLLLSPSSALQLARFLCYVNGNLAKEAGRVHNWKHHVWSRRYQLVLVANEEKAQIARLRYLLSHGVKEGLIDRVADWPGPNFLSALLTGAPAVGTWFDRTAECKARMRGLEFGVRDFATDERVVLTPIPCWQNLTREQHARAVQALVDSIDSDAAAEREATGRPCLGAAAILRQSPEATPTRFKKSPAPWFHAASRAARAALKEAFAIFLSAYRRAAERLRAGDRMVEFPPGAFPPALPIRV